jgi:hypothetical protein
MPDFEVTIPGNGNGLYIFSPDEAGNISRLEFAVWENGSTSYFSANLEEAFLIQHVISEWIESQI